MKIIDLTIKKKKLNRKKEIELKKININQLIYNYLKSICNCKQ